MDETLLNRLARRAAEIQNQTCDQQFIENLRKFLEAQQLEVQDGWVKYVDRIIQQLWSTLDVTARLVVYLTAFKVYREISARTEPPTAPPYH